MKWFEGGIPSAIQTAKTNKSMFIVFISNENEASLEMESCLHQDSVTSLCEKSQCVAVKLSSQSNDCKFFSQIYPVVLIPSMFFIGDNGVPLEVIGEIKSAQDFLEKVKSVLAMQQKSVHSRDVSQSPADASTLQPQESSQTRSSAVSTGQTRAQDVNSRSSGEVEGATAAVPEKKAKMEEKSLDQRLEKAKEIIELKNEEKARKEADDERQKEIERRKIGQGVQKLRQQQKEMEVLEAKKELKKEKEEERLARQRVRDEIARDRAEKAARFQEEKDERSRKAEELKKQKLLEEQAQRAQETAMRSNTARIQFRMPDGSSVNHQFPAGDAFSEVKSFITAHMNTSVTLSTTFPRRTFSSEDETKTLQELQLAPSAAILVIPTGSNTSGVRSSSDSSLSLATLTSAILAPLFFIWGYVASILGLSSKRNTNQTQGNDRAKSSPTSATGGERYSPNVQNRGTSKAEGSVHRFRNAEDDKDPDDTSTWNGNSTQQM